MDMKILMISISKSNFEINNYDHKMEKKVEGGDEEEFCSIGNLGQKALHLFG
jgi:hypothetical protein